MSNSSSDELLLVFWLELIIGQNETMVMYVSLVKLLCEADCVDC